ncbi:MAG: hypothetical protein GXO79_00975 [Chlorobi bacterium]|nr:hypothetical protein [Chlorobiota bacterium]
MNFLNLLSIIIQQVGNLSYPIQLLQGTNKTNPDIRQLLSTKQIASVNYNCYIQQKDTPTIIGIIFHNDNPDILSLRDQHSDPQF